MRHCIPGTLREDGLSFEDPLYVCKLTDSWLLSLSPELPFSVACCGCHTCETRFEVCGRVLLGRE